MKIQDLFYCLECADFVLSKLKKKKKKALSSVIRETD